MDARRGRVRPLLQRLTRPRRRRDSVHVTRLSTAIGLSALLCLICGCANTQDHTKPTTSPNTSTSPVVLGRKLYEDDGCADCHSLNGTRMTGPSWKGLAGSQVKLSDGRTITADNAYLTRHIIEPNALTVQGYPGEVMAEAIEGLNLKSKPSDVRALVAFIDSLR